MAKLDVLVVGSTGHQGGAVARALLRGGHHVRALTRNLGHPAADTLRMRGARLAWADLDDHARIEDVMSGVDAIFVITSPGEDGTDRETQRGLALADIARRAGSPHFVYASYAGAAQRTGIPHYDSKHEVEQYLRATGMPHTIVCPAFFMENLLEGTWLDNLRAGKLLLPLSPSRKLQLIARADVGRFVRVVLEQRSAFLGRRINIAADEQTPIEMAASLARIAGQRIQYVQQDTAATAPQHADGEDFAWLEQHGGGADVSALRRDYPEVNWHTLDGWARRQDWAAITQPTRQSL